MSTYREFTPEEIQTMVPWQLPDIGIEEDEAHYQEEEVELFPTLTAEEIEAIQKQAYEEAAEQGRQDGHRDGQKKGYDEGYQEGRKVGETELLEKQREYAKRLDQILVALESPLAELDERVEQELVLLTVAIAKQVVRRELHIDPGEIVATARSAVAALPSASRDITLHLHPDDAEMVKAALSLHDSGSQWKILEDPLISHGGCRVTSESSLVDATVEKRLAQAIAKVLGDERESSA